MIYLAVTLQAAGGTPPYAWSATGMPPGLSVSPQGVVTGNNTAAGNFSLTVTVADSAGASASRSAGMRVYPALTVSQPCANLCQVEEGCTICGAFGSVGGGLPPYHYTVLVDNRPVGMGLNGLSLTGTFPAPGPLGQFSLTVQVKDDQFGATQTVTANWFVFPHIVMSGQTAFTCGFSGSSCLVQIPYSGGTPGGSPSIRVVSVSDAIFSNQDQGPPKMFVPSAGSCFFAGPPPAVTPTGLPPGTTVSASAGFVSLSIGPPNASYCGYTARVTLVLVDQSPCGPGNCATATVATIDIGI